MMMMMMICRPSGGEPPVRQGRSEVSSAPPRRWGRPSCCHRAGRSAQPVTLGCWILLA